MSYRDVMKRANYLERKRIALSKVRYAHAKCMKELKEYSEYTERMRLNFVLKLLAIRKLENQGYTKESMKGILEYLEFHGMYSLFLNPKCTIVGI